MHWLLRILKTLGQKSPWEKLFMLLIVGVMFLGVLPAGKFLQILELQSLSIRQRMLPVQDRSRWSPITVVKVDPKSLRSFRMNTLFGRYPWRREAYAHFIHFMKRSQPQDVLMDISYNGGPDWEHPESDARFAQSLQGTRNMASVLMAEAGRDPALRWQAHSPVVQQALGRQTLTVQGLERLPGLAGYFANMIPPIEILLQSPMHFYTATGLNDDASGIVRRWTSISNYDGHLIPTLGLGAVLNGERTLRVTPEGLLQWKGGQVHLGPEGLPVIKWYGNMLKTYNSHGQPREIYPTVSLSDVIESELVLACREDPSQAMCSKVTLPAQPSISPLFFHGKYVLVGLTADTFMSDMHRTIYYNGSKYPGVYVWANILDNLLHDDFVYPAPPWLDGLVFLGMLALMGFAVVRFESILLGFCFMAALVAGEIVLSIYAYGHWNLWLNTVYPVLGTLCVYGGGYVWRYQQTEKRKQQLRFAFGKYVSPGVMQTIEKNPEEIQLGGQKRELTMLFCDLRGFTTFSENNDAEYVQGVLSEYFSEMNGIILHTYHGSINKLIGDAIMAYWGFPLENEDHVFLAVSAALAMRDAMEAWRQDPTKPPLKIGIGINTGEVMIGNVGSEDFMDFTVIGDAVNLASRLEGENKTFATTIIISEATYERVKDRVTVRPLGEVKVKGKEQPVQIYEPLELKG